MIMNRKRLLLIAVPLAVAGSVLTAAVVAVAASPSPSPSSSGSDASQIFVQKLAGILHLSQGQTQDDLKQAELQTVDQLVKDGKLTQAQANQIKQRIQSGKGPLVGIPGARGPVNQGLASSLRTAELNAAAGALGMSPSDLQTQLRSGKSLAELEQSKGVSDSTVRSAMHDAAKKVLDQAVKDGQVTQSQEDAILQRISTGKGIGPGGRGFGGHRPGQAPGAPPSPSSTP
jgi:polyhydroxyalkanoate synthesis regulator phasin